MSELAGWVAANGGNIRHADHHTDSGAGLFLSRIEWELDGFGLPRHAIEPAVSALAERLGMTVLRRAGDRAPRPAQRVPGAAHAMVVAEEAAAAQRRGGTTNRSSVYMRW